MLFQINRLQPQDLANRLEEFNLLATAELDGRFRETHVWILGSMRRNARKLFVGINPGGLENHCGQRRVLTHSVYFIKKRALYEQAKVLGPWCF